MEDVSKINYLMVDPYTCKPFRATNDEVNRIQKEINSRIDSDGHISRYDIWDMIYGKLIAKEETE